LKKAMKKRAGKRAKMEVCKGVRTQGTRSWWANEKENAVRSDLHQLFECVIVLESLSNRDCALIADSVVVNAVQWSRSGSGTVAA
jgi:phage gp46-like protein